MKSISVVTQPFQFFVLLMMGPQLPCLLNSPILLVNNFKGASTFFNSLVKTFPSLDISFVESFDQLDKVIFSGKYSTIFIDSDIGSKRFFQALFSFLYRSPISYIVYEEGIGVYRTNIRGSLYTFLSKLIGFGYVFGSNRFTHKIYVIDKFKYDSKLPFLSKKSVQIKVELLDMFEKYKVEISQLISDLDTCLKNFVSDRRVILLLPEKNASLPSNAAFLEDSDCDKFVKYHPSLRANAKYRLNHFQEVDPLIPAEMLIFYLSNASSSLIVYHMGSSATYHRYGLNVEFVNLNQI